MFINYHSLWNAALIKWALFHCVTEIAVYMYNWSFCDDNYVKVSVISFKLSYIISWDVVSILIGWICFEVFLSTITKCTYPTPVILSFLPLILVNNLEHFYWLILTKRGILLKLNQTWLFWKKIIPLLMSTHLKNPGQSQLRKKGLKPVPTGHVSTSCLPGLQKMILLQKLGCV